MGKVDDLLARVFPRRCVLCNEPSGAGSVCEGCRDDLPWLTNVCPSCGAPLPRGSPCHCAGAGQTARIIGSRPSGGGGGARGGGGGRGGGRR